MYIHTNKAPIWSRVLTTLCLASAEFFGDIYVISLYNIENTWCLFPGTKVLPGTYMLPTALTQDRVS